MYPSTLLGPVPVKSGLETLQELMSPTWLMWLQLYPSNQSRACSKSPLSGLCVPPSMSQRGSNLRIQGVFRAPWPVTMIPFLSSTNSGSIQLETSSHPGTGIRVFWRFELIIGNYQNSGNDPMFFLFPRVRRLKTWSSLHFSTVSGMSVLMVLGFPSITRCLQKVGDFQFQFKFRF